MTIEKRNPLISDQEIIKGFETSSRVDHEVQIEEPLKFDIEDLIDEEDQKRLKKLLDDQLNANFQMNYKELCKNIILIRDTTTYTDLTDRLEPELSSCDINSNETLSDSIDSL